MLVLNGGNSGHGLKKVTCKQTLMVDVFFTDITGRFYDLFTVQQLLENKPSLGISSQVVTDLQALAQVLLETVNDKNLALSHQRKTNK